MKIVSNPRRMQAIVRKLRLNRKTIGLVPTMGALHEGHLSLVRRSRRENDITVVSIFVNPAQFGPHEDYKKYPRPVRRDVSFCKKEGVDFIFYPPAGKMYPAGFKTHVNVEGLDRVLCGKSRPGHFRGVATVVAKLFNLISPDSAYFGQKDAQQVAVIKRMAGDLDFPIKIKVMPIIRQKNGLALSSRNAYLSKEESQDAAVLYKSLQLARKMFNCGTRDSAAIISAMRRLINSKKSASIDYVAAVDPDSLQPVKRMSAGCLLALAVRIGKTRLIDNICLN